MSEQKKVLSIPVIVKKIKDGMTREEIKAEYNLSSHDYKLMCNLPQIKGIRTGIKSDVLFTEDVEVDYQDHPGAAHN
jgi:hypothetical protein